MQETSLEAYESIKAFLGKRQKQVFEFMHGKGAMTDREISDGMNIPINCITNRRGELVELKLVKFAGYKTGSSGRRAMLWDAVVVERLFK